MYEINPDMKIPRQCLLIGTYWYKECHECPLGYNRANTCESLLEENKIVKECLNQTEMKGVQDA